MEIDSGLDGERGKLHRLLANAGVSVIVLEHRDRLARFGLEHLEAVLSATGRRRLVLDEQETIDDLVQVVASMWARVYGRRSAGKRAARGIAVAMGDPR